MTQRDEGVLLVEESRGVESGGNFLECNCESSRNYTSNVGDADFS